MDQSLPVYVLDTNILVDYVDIIPGDGHKEPRDPSIDLDHAHIVIPSVVIRELSNFKKEKSDRGLAARTALRRLRALANTEIYPMHKVYNLNAMTQRQISILPVHKNFKKSLPFSPSDNDMDGQIILTAIAAAMIQNGLPIDGTAPTWAVEDLASDSVTLLTNDNGLAIRASERGIKTERYNYRYAEPYTGRRDLIVTRDLFHEFYATGKIPLEMWSQQMPDQPRLVANEFIVMRLNNINDYPNGYDYWDDPYFGYIGKFDAREQAIVKLRHIRGFPTRLKNAGQAIYAEALADTDISAVICTGPAGTGKTYMSTIYGYQSCKSGAFIGVTVIPCESDSKLGALPGDLDEKMDPTVQPLKNALRNYLMSEDIKFRKELETLAKFGPGNKAKNQDDDDDVVKGKSIKVRLADRVDLIWDNWFSNVPVENARGRDFASELAIYDEFQDQTISQADMLIKRIGTSGKIVITGDLKQIHAPYVDEKSSGLTYVSWLLFDSPMVAQVHFTEDEVVRHPLVKMIAERQRNK